MSSPPRDQSIEDVMEDLQLQNVLLCSLEEEQPNATGEREEIECEIERLQKKLAGMRRDRFKDMFGRKQSSSHASASDMGMSRAQVDGGSDVESSGGSKAAMAAPARSTNLPGAPMSSSSSKRPFRDADLGADSGPSTAKRAATSQNVPSNPSNASVHSQNSSDDDFEGADELRELLGFGGREALREMQDEQRKAEKWLEEKKVQERRDAEYARSLQDGLFESPRAQRQEPVANDPLHGGSGPPTTSRPPSPVFRHSSSPVPRRDNLPSYQGPSLNPPAPGPVPPYAGETSRSAFGPPPSFTTASRPDPVRLDSDDSEYDFDDYDFPSFSPAPALSNASSSYPSVNPWARNVPSNEERVRQIKSLMKVNPKPSPNFYQGAMDASKGLMGKTGQSIYNDISNPYSDPLSDPLSYLQSFEQYGELNPFRSTDYDDFVGDPKKAREEIKQLLETIRPDLEISKDSREGTPEALKHSLMEHQKVGLTWMKSMEESDQKGGILADDMGLGKTIQALALIVARPSPDPARKTTLIVAPVSLMHQWKREIQTMLKPGRHQRSVYVLHGEKRGVSFRDLKRYDVVLTTFGTMASELKRKGQWDELELKNVSPEDIARTISLPVLGPRSQWYRVIVDEAQCIKNRNTKAALACCRIDSIHRWCMSGTPMMNNVSELHSLLKFLRIRPYCSLDKFNIDFTRPLKNGGPEQEKAMAQLQVLLKAVLLRRTKTSQIDGKPILQLPPRISEKVHATFSEDERQLYDALESKTQLQFNKYLRAGTVGRNYSQVLVLLLRLRQACCHPHLMKDFSVDVNAETQDLNLAENAKKFIPQVVARLKESDNLECPICIDAVDNPIIFFPCGHSACAECFSRMTDPAAGVMQGNEGTVEVKCPNCRAKIDPKKITDNISFRKVHYGEHRDAAGDEFIQKSDEDDDDDDDDEDDDDSDDSLSRFIVDDDEDEDYGKSKSKNNKNKNKKSNNSKGKQARKPKKTMADLKKDSHRNAASRRKYLRRLQKTWVSSAKVDKAMDILQGIEDRATGEKTIIFSQFTSLLDLLEVPIMRKGWGYRRYDGSMRAGDRNSAVIEFTDNPNCKIMLVSLKAGNSGLNLVAASQVIIFDPFWNPYIEEQAIDRAHRIGQVREVNIHRILVEKTVEDRILELQERKRELIEGALDETASKNISRLGTQELAYLFGAN